MLVKELLEKIGIASDNEKEVTGICFDSRKVKDGNIFVAYKGADSDGNDYIWDAFNNGAVCVVSDRLVGYDVYKSNNINLDKETMIREFYDFRKIKFIGITGTNGKTSSAHLLYQALNYLGIRTTYVGTLGVIDNEYFQELDNTTPDMDVLAREVEKAIDRKCKYIVMEVSSHSLSMNRIAPFYFDIVAFTNFTQDHLDYYQTMDEYFKAKKILFDRADENCIGVVNSEDTSSFKLISDFKGRIVTYGHKGNYDYRILKNNLNGLKFKVDENIIDTKLVYKTNLYNLLLVYTILSLLNYDKEDIKKALEDVSPIPGRMEILKNKNKYVILDYAHTPDAVEKIVKETNKIKKGKVYVLFGCGGNRDKSKRAIMGKIASEYGDYIYLTNDNPRNEDEMVIINDILTGITNPNIVIEKDRKKAIETAIDNLKKGDILLVLGKGHEEYQIINNKKYHFSDKEIILQCLEK